MKEIFEFESLEKSGVGMNLPRRRGERALGNMIVRTIENSEKSPGLHVDVSCLGLQL
jgi:hypothetical protein